MHLSNMDKVIETHAPDLRSFSQRLLEERQSCRLHRVAMLVQVSRIEPELLMVRAKLAARFCNSTLAQDQRLFAFCQSATDNCPFLESDREHRYSFFGIRSIRSWTAASGVLFS